MSSKKIFLSSPALNGMEMEYIQDAFESNWVAPLGPHVDAFEMEMADCVTASYAAALSSGTAAIHLALKAVGVGSGDVVFCSSLTFAATCNPIIYQNAIPVFIDSESDTWGMSPSALHRAFQKYPHPKAVIAVNLYGTPAKLDQICALCKEHNVPLIEDAAESLGSTYLGKQTGTFGDFGVFSFNGNKIITTSGGGMLVSENKSLIEKTRFWATQARDPARYYQHSELGYNYRMSNICAGIGRGQLKTLELRIQQKSNIYNSYEQAFSGFDAITMNPIPYNCKCNHWLSCLTLAVHSKTTPLDIMIALEQENIESRPIWKPMNLQPFYQCYDFFGCNDDCISVGEDIFNRGICLPSDVNMTQLEQQKVIDLILEQVSTESKAGALTCSGVS